MACLPSPFTERQLSGPKTGSALRAKSSYGKKKKKKNPQYLLNTELNMDSKIISEDMFFIMDIWIKVNCILDCKIHSTNLR